MFADLLISKKEKNLFNTYFRKTKQTNHVQTTYGSTTVANNYIVVSWPAIKLLTSCTAPLKQAPASTCAHLDQWLSQVAEIPHDTSIPGSTSYS